MRQDFKKHGFAALTAILLAGIWAWATQPVGISGSPPKFVAATDGSQLTSLNASSVSSGTLGVQFGGTGLGTLTANAVLIGNGTSNPTFASTAVTGPVLTGVAGGPPAFADPITSIAGSSTLGANYTISGDNGAYESTGLCESLPAAGTYLTGYEVRSNITAVTTAGAYILLELFNTTDSAAVANSEQIGAYGSTVSTSYYGTPSTHMIISVGAAKTICVYTKVVAPSSTSSHIIYSDTNGRSRIWYVKLNYQ
jgi:hypothetical protein